MVVGMEEASRIDFPEVAGKTVAELSVLNDPVSGREVLVEFTDQTQLSICVGMKQTVEARYTSDGIPEPPIFARRE